MREIWSREKGGGIDQPCAYIKKRPMEKIKGGGRKEEVAAGCGR